MSLVSFYTTWKHQNLWFPDIFRRYKRRPVTWNGLIYSFTMHPFSTPWKHHWVRMGREQLLTVVPEISCSKKSSKISEKTKTNLNLSKSSRAAFKENIQISASIYRWPKTRNFRATRIFLKKKDYWRVTLSRWDFMFPLVLYKLVYMLFFIYENNFFAWASVFLT